MSNKERARKDGDFDLSDLPALEDNEMFFLTVLASFFQATCLYL